MGHIAIPSGHGAGIELMLAFVLVIVTASALWVYGDAKEQAKRGNQVVCSMKSFELSTPAAWFFCCLVFWELALPLYINSRTPID